MAKTKGLNEDLWLSTAAIHNSALKGMLYLQAPEATVQSIIKNTRCSTPWKITENKSEPFPGSFFFFVGQKKQNRKYLGSMMQVTFGETRRNIWDQEHLQASIEMEM